mmetsp:Transcript_1042/g.1605  ORF Transcript_1042/g.1605 Transcript_1042/m.1605 type:complete len:182 (-) Transcript_1042:73-618(-)
MEILDKTFSALINFAGCDAQTVRDSIKLDEELFDLVEFCSNGEVRDDDPPNISTSKTEFVVDLMAKQFPPSSVLEMMYHWSPRLSSSTAIIPALRTVLTRAAVHGFRNRELSGALLRIQRARDELIVDLDDSFEVQKTSQEEKLMSSSFSSTGLDLMRDEGAKCRGKLWSRLLDGTAIIDK